MTRRSLVQGPSTCRSFLQVLSLARGHSSLALSATNHCTASHRTNQSRSALSVSSLTTLHADYASVCVLGNNGVLLAESSYGSGHLTAKRRALLRVRRTSARENVKAVSLINLQAIQITHSLVLTQLSARLQTLFR